MDTVPPADAEIEVSLFGPRYGECVVIHVGSGKWIVVDSCLSPKGDRPIAIQYLAQLGVDVSTQVELIVATHWHDDHVRGLASLVGACTAANVYCSAALSFREFLEASEIYGNDAPFLFQSKMAPGMREFRNAIQVLGTRELKLAQASMLVWRDSSTPTTEVWALSPSQLEVRLSQRILAREFRGLLDSARHSEEPIRKLRSRSPNHTAVALWITVGQVDLLLGSDLEETGHAGLGWGAVVASNTRPSRPTMFVKVPHHGSPTAFFEPMWRFLTHPDCVAGVTPFVRGKVQLPRPSDVERITQVRPQLYLTAPPRARTAKIQSSAVRKTIAESTRRFEDRHPPFGHVRWRHDASGAGGAIVHLDGAAFRCQ